MIRLVWFLGFLLIGRRRKILRLALIAATFTIEVIFRRRRKVLEASSGSAIER
jgi:hypothetical protein